MRDEGEERLRGAVDDERRRDPEQVTERIPRWEMWEDGIEPDEELPLALD